MNKDNEWLTVLTVETQTKIPNATIRRYIRNHGHHLNIRKKGKSYLINSESISIILEIRKQYDDGKNHEQVEEALSQQGKPMIITVTADDKQMTVDIGEALQDMQLAVQEQNKVIQLLIEQVQTQQKYIDTKLEERDRKLMAALRETQESRNQVIVTDYPNPGKNKKWYQIWK